MHNICCVSTRMVIYIVVCKKCQQIASKHENKLEEDMDSALQLMATKQDNKIQQEMDSALETKLKTVNKDIACTNETLMIVKQNAE